MAHDSNLLSRELCEPRVNGIHYYQKICGAGFAWNGSLVAGW